MAKLLGPLQVVLKDAQMPGTAMRDRQPIGDFRVLGCCLLLNFQLADRSGGVAFFESTQYRLCSPLGDIVLIQGPSEGETE